MSLASFVGIIRKLSLAVSSANSEKRVEGSFLKDK